MQCTRKSIRTVNQDIKDEKQTYLTKRWTRDHMQKMWEISPAEAMSSIWGILSQVWKAEPLCKDVWIRPSTARKDNAHNTQVLHTQGSGKSTILCIKALIHTYPREAFV